MQLRYHDSFKLFFKKIHPNLDPVLREDDEREGDVGVKKNFVFRTGSSRNDRDSPMITKIDLLLFRMLNNRRDFTDEPPGLKFGYVKPGLSSLKW